jgi:TolB-like protein/DNA-binding winged helix-turn-helix (wHTH) protein
MSHATAPTVESNRSAIEVFHLGEWRVDTCEGTLQRRRETAHLEPKVMAVLAFLAENQGHVVSKGQLLHAVWPDTIVEEVALARSVSEIRRVLGDDARQPRYIQTIPTRGYRLIASVCPDTPGRPSGDARRFGRRLPVTLAMGLVLTVTLLAYGLPTWGPGRGTVAVLPFEDLSRDATSATFADGVTEDVITQLSSVSGLRVTSRTSVMRYKHARQSLPEIATELGVRTVIEGSVRREGNRVRIVGQIIDAAADTHLWAGTFDRGLADTLEVQREVAIRMAEALQHTLRPTPGEPTAAQARVGWMSDPETEPAPQVDPAVSDP